MRNFIKTGALLALVIFCGCKSTSSPSPTSGNSINGNMVGYVAAYDSTGSKTDNSGVKISIDGTSYSSLSDSKGRWELDNVVPGTYNISYTKDGYAMEKIIAYRFVGNGTDYLFSQDIYQSLRTHASLVIRPFSNGTAVFSCRIFRNNTSESLSGLALLLFAKDSSFSPIEPNSYLYSEDNHGLSNDTLRGYDFRINSSDLNAAGYKSGDNIYCVGYASNVNVWLWDIQKQQSTLVPSYFDIASGKLIYTAFGNNHSEVRSFVLP